MQQFWNQRYGAKEYAYGVEPNVFLRQVLDNYDFQGKILLPAEGEGRNAVYAAKKGLEVFAFDLSAQGKNKALKLAQQQNVSINYEVGELDNLELLKHQYDVAALIFAHFNPKLYPQQHQKITALVKANGYLILEGFSQQHAKYQRQNPRVGGPQDAAMLFTTEAIKNDFANFEIILLEEKEVVLNEGLFHIGNSKVIRFIGKKRCA